MTDFESTRSAREIGQRALLLGFILSAFELKGQKEKLNAELVELARPVMQLSDRELLQRGDWSPEVQRDLLWQLESLAVLLWALGKLPALPGFDTMVEPGLVVAEIDAMSLGPAGWLESLALRPPVELDAYNERLAFWLWRSRTPSGNKSEQWAESVLERGVLRPDEVSEGDAIAWGQPFFRIPQDKQALLGEIVEERCRAMYWLWRDFDDWWDPILDS